MSGHVLRICAGSAFAPLRPLSPTKVAANRCPRSENTKHNYNLGASWAGPKCMEKTVQGSEDTSLQQFDDEESLLALLRFDDPP